MKVKILTIVILSLIIVSCSSSDNDPEPEAILGCTDPNSNNYTASATQDDGSCEYGTAINLEIPEIFGNLLLPPLVPTNNPQTIEGIALGRQLFYEKKLSGDGTQACAACHFAEFSFVDPARFSTGITGAVGNRNSMPIYNLAWNFEDKYFWDGRAIGIEGQALGPVENPIEMNNTWSNAVATLQATSNYPDLFAQAFGTTTITKELVTKAIAQFERTMISGNSRFDQYVLGDTGALTASEINGFNVFMDESRGDCFHCHGSDSNPLWTDNIFHNNGLDSSFEDLGLGMVTGDPLDNGKFKSPSLRNLAYTSPYMHDGRFETLEEVINHYSEGLVYSETIDPLMKNIAQGGAQLTEADKVDLKAFLLSLSEPGFTTNPDFHDPN
ncbi:MAG: cytochrome-c peroxidase [Flavobacteriaceae bacterium]|nr:cytochrome-c peroxidase [Flavobacteriaceae bacterium]